MNGGPTFAEDGTTMNGSWMLLREESKNKARARLERDIYNKGGAWDFAKVSSGPRRETLRDEKKHKSKAND